MTPIALTILVQEGPIARSYLGILNAAGYRVERIILMVQKRDPVFRRLFAPWLPIFLRQPFARTMQDLRMNHWPRKFLRNHSSLCKPWLDLLGHTYSFDPAVYQCLIERSNYKRYADIIDEVFVDGLCDPALEKHLCAMSGHRTILFTGGGMVPKSLLSIPQLRFIHVHPGVLPSVRGADGLLWSMLLRGRPGATAFFMAPGLDTGNIILASDFDIPPIPIGFSDLDVDMSYRLMYSFVDPILRAILLLRVVAQAKGDMTTLPSVPQSEEEGTTFHFMNKRTRRYVFDRLSILTPNQSTDALAGEREDE